MLRVGTGKFIYELADNWGRLPEGWSFVEVAGVAVDSQDRVYVLCRGEHPVIVFDYGGQFLESWGEGMFKRGHCVFVGPDDSIYCVDDWGHAVRKFRMDGTLLWSISTAGHPADTGYVWSDSSTILRSGPPFNYPTGVALSPQGDLYVADGYGNARVHKFSPDGRLLCSWGDPGQGPGQFVTPHGICVDKMGRVYVADRENARIQIFSPDGEFLGQWGDVRRPTQMCLDGEGNMYVSEMGFVFASPEPDLNKPPARVTVRELSGKVLAEWGERDPYGAGMYFAPHGIAIDSRGNLYLTEVTMSYCHGSAPAGRSVLRKYVRVFPGTATA